MCLCLLCSMPSTRLFNSVWFHPFNFGLIDLSTQTAHFLSKWFGKMVARLEWKVDDFNMRKVQKIPLYLLCLFGERERAWL